MLAKIIVSVNLPPWGSSSPRIPSIKISNLLRSAGSATGNFAAEIPRKDVICWETILKVELALKTKTKNITASIIIKLAKNKNIILSKDFSLRFADRGEVFISDLNSLFLSNKSFILLRFKPKTYILRVFDSFMFHYIRTFIDRIRQLF